MPNESKLVWGPLKQALDRTAMLNSGSAWAYDRLESRVGLGIPDANVHVPNSQDVWIELKYATLPAADGRTIRVGLEAEQYIWMRQAARKGRRCLLLARVSPTRAGERIRELAWRVWTEEKDWELAKHPAPMYVMMANSEGFRSPEEFLLWLGSWNGRRTR